MRLAVNLRYAADIKLSPAQLVEINRRLRDAYGVQHVTSTGTFGTRVDLAFSIDDAIFTSRLDQLAAADRYWLQRLADAVAAVEYTPDSRDDDDSEVPAALPIYVLAASIEELNPRRHGDYPLQTITA